MVHICPSCIWHEDCEDEKDSLSRDASVNGCGDYVENKVWLSFNTKDIWDDFVATKGRDPTSEEIDSIIAEIGDAECPIKTVNEWISDIITETVDPFGGYA